MHTTHDDQQFVSLAASQLSEVVGGQAQQCPIGDGGSAAPSPVQSSIPSPLPQVDPAQQGSAAPTQQSSVDPTQQYFQGAGSGKTGHKRHHHKGGKCDD